MRWMVAQPLDSLPTSDDDLRHQPHDEEPSHALETLDGDGHRKRVCTVMPSRRAQRLDAVPYERLIAMRGSTSNGRVCGASAVVLVAQGPRPWAAIGQAVHGDRLSNELAMRPDLPDGHSASGRY